jgi:hypothetical protein
MRTHLVPRLNKFSFRNLKNFFFAGSSGLRLYGALSAHIDGLS